MPWGGERIIALPAVPILLSSTNPSCSCSYYNAENRPAEGVCVFNITFVWALNLCDGQEVFVVTQDKEDTERMSQYLRVRVTRIQQMLCFSFYGEANILEK